MILELVPIPAADAALLPWPRCPAGGGGGAEDERRGFSFSFSFSSRWWRLLLRDEE